MKKYIVVLMLAMVAGLSVYCQPKIVPIAVKTSFSTKYPGATNVKWGMENSNEYEAEFTMNNMAVSANFKLDGSWVETETTINASELPEAVTSAIIRKYPGASITVAEKTEQPGNKVLYEVVISVNGKKKPMELNPDGTVAH